MPGQELPDIGDLLFGMVNTKRIEIEEDPMGKVEIGGAALDDKADQFLIAEILLDDHEGDDLRDEVLDVITLVVAVDYWVDSFGGEQLVNPR